MRRTILRFAQALVVLMKLLDLFDCQRSAMSESSRQGGNSCTLGVERICLSLLGYDFVVLDRLAP